MTLPLQITFRNMDPDPALEALVQKENAALERFFPQIMGCRVAVEAPRRQGGLYRVRIDLTAPNAELIVKRAPSVHRTLVATEAARKTKQSETKTDHQQPRIAIREAFQEMRRRLQNYSRRVQGRVKVHEPLAMAKVAKLFPEMGYGFLETHDGRQIYFHKNSVLDGHYDHLRLGSEIHFAEEPGEQGPQASTVRLIHRANQLRKAAKTVPLAARKKAGR